MWSEVCCAGANKGSPKWKKPLCCASDSDHLVAFYNCLWRCKENIKTPVCIENIPSFSYVTCYSQLHINMMVQCPETCGIEKRNVAQNNELWTLELIILAIIKGWIIHVQNNSRVQVESSRKMKEYFFFFF